MKKSAEQIATEILTKVSAGYVEDPAERAKKQFGTAKDKSLPKFPRKAPSLGAFGKRKAGGPTKPKIDYDFTRK